MNKTSDVERFRDELRQLYLAAGQPKAQRLIGRGSKQKPPVELNASSLSDWFNRKSIPADPAAVRFVTAFLEDLAEQATPGYRPRGERWWLDLHHRARDQQRRTRGAPPPTEPKPQQPSEPRPPGPPSANEPRQPEPPSPSGPRPLLAGLWQRRRLTTLVTAAAALVLLAAFVLVVIRPDRPPSDVATDVPPAGSTGSKPVEGSPSSTPVATTKPPARATPSSTPRTTRTTPTPRTTADTTRPHTPPPSTRTKPSVAAGPPPEVELDLSWVRAAPYCRKVRIYPSKEALQSILDDSHERLDDYPESVEVAAVTLRGNSPTQLRVDAVGIRVVGAGPTSGIRAYEQPRHVTSCGKVPKERISVDLGLPTPGATEFEEIRTDPENTPLPVTTSNTDQTTFILPVTRPAGSEADYEWQFAVKWTDPSRTVRWTALNHTFRTSSADVYKYTQDGEITAH